MLTVGYVNNLFDEQKKNDLKNLVRDECKRLKLGESNEEIWNFYINKVT